MKLCGDYIERFHVAWLNIVEVVPHDCTPANRPTVGLPTKRVVRTARSVRAHAQEVVAAARVTHATSRLHDHVGDHLCVAMSLKRLPDGVRSVHATGSGAVDCNAL